MKFNKFNKFNKLLSGLSVLTVMLMASGGAQAGIASTKHNLGTDGTQTNKLSAGTAEICVFCHTPHGADTSAKVPLWNRALESSPGTFYTTYDTLGTSSLDGKVMDVGSVSIACLSCHDGTQAMDVVINTPGSGGYVAAAAAMGGVTAWAGANQTSGAISAGLITNIGKVLTNDHPIGIQYAGGGYTESLTTAGSGVGDGDFNAATHDTVNSNDIWWVDTEATPNGTREKTDMQLYTRNYLAEDQPFVECASCHDPHSSANSTFLRISNDGSKVCLACHNK